MITIKQLKNIASDIKSDDSWVTDSHSGAEHKGICDGLERLINHREEIECDECKKDETEWLNNVADYIQDNKPNLYNEACEYADKLEDDE